MNYYKPSRETDEACEDFARWSNRFALASWGFLFLGIIMLFMGQYRSSLVGLAASLFWF